MTNYEWLIKNDRLDEFLENLHVTDWEELHKIYNIPNGTHTAKWLQEKHIYKYKYVIETETYFDPSEERYKIHRIEYSDDVAQLFKDTTFYDTLDEARAVLVKIIEEKIRTNV